MDQFSEVELIFQFLMKPIRKDFLTQISIKVTKTQITDMEMESQWRDSVAILMVLSISESRSGKFGDWFLKLIKCEVRSKVLDKVLSYLLEILY
jgi:hypothetical protein